ncbi:MAG TPA: hypothetical protein EYP17_08555 [Candidatus Latescibacteria bacterium]|nr:hypothetical protein [Candidatus Latescibacterota bacterium]
MKKVLIGMVLLWMSLTGCERATTVRFLVRTQARLALERSKKIGVVCFIQVPEAKDKGISLGDRVLEMVGQDLQRHKQFQLLWGDEVRWALGWRWAAGDTAFGYAELAKPGQLQRIQEVFGVDGLLAIEGYLHIYAPKVMVGHPRPPGPPPELAWMLQQGYLPVNVEVQLKFRLLSLPSGEEVWSRSLSRNFIAPVTISFGGDPLESRYILRPFLRTVRYMLWEFRADVTPRHFYVERKFALE